MKFTVSRHQWNLDLHKVAEELEIPVPHTAILKMSGGLDSTAMGYCVALYKKHEYPDLKLKVVTINGYAPKNWNVQYAHRILDRITHLTGVEFDERIVGEQATPGLSAQQEREYVGREELWIDGDVDPYGTAVQKTAEPHWTEGTVAFTGVTANPPTHLTQFYQDYLPEVYGGDYQAPELQVRTPDKIRQEYDKSSSTNRMWWQPWTNWHKQDLAELYNNLAIMDTLFPLTRSCEGMGSEILARKHCGECWWCQERLWGFGRLQ